MAYSVVTAPTFEPLTLAEVKLQVKEDYSTNDSLLTSLIKSARQQVEMYLNRFLPATTIDEYFDGFPAYTVNNPNQVLFLTKSPVSNIVSIKYNDSTGSQQTLPESKYRDQTYFEPVRITPSLNESWPNTSEQIGNVIVRYTAGYTQASDIPSPIKQAMLLMIAHSYANREDTASRYPMASLRMLDFYRVKLF